MQWTEMTKEQLLALPTRKWNKTSTYRSILLVSTRKKHDSGYNYYAIVGIGDNMELVGYVDDITFENNTGQVVQIDCSMKGVFRLWLRAADAYKFEVGENISSTDITVIKE